MNRTTFASRGRRERSTIRFTSDPLVGADSIEFLGVAEDGKQHRFQIAADTLRSIGRGGIDGLGLAEAFERRRPAIHGVARRTFCAGVRSDPIVLVPALFASGLL